MKPSWQLVKSPSSDTDMVFVYPYDSIGHTEIQDIIMQNGFGKVLGAIAEQERSRVDHLNVINYSFLVTRKNTKLHVHLDYEPTLQGHAWNVIVPLELVRNSAPELVVLPTRCSERHQLVQYKKDTAIILGAKQWHSSGLYEYNRGEKFRYCLCIAVCHITPENVDDIIKSMDGNYPLPSRISIGGVGCKTALEINNVIGNGEGYKQRFNRTARK